MKHIYSLTFFLLCSILAVHGQTSTKSTAVGSVSIDGCGTYCTNTNLSSVSFGPADFSSGCVVNDVDVSITWAKTAGSCESPTVDYSFHSETSFRVDGPSNMEVLIPQGYYGGGETMPAITTVFNQGSPQPTVAGGTPQGGTFSPVSSGGGNLNDFNGTSAFGTWWLRAGDNAGGDPLCVDQYSITISTVTDNTPPSFTSGPGNITVYTSNTVGSCGAVVSWSPPVASDVCGGVTVSQLSGIGNGQPFPIGTSTISYGATDRYGNATSGGGNYVFTVTVIDDESPIISNCPSSFTASSQCGTNVTWLAPSASDNCSVQTFGQTGGLAPGSNFPQGQTVVTYTALDNAGNSASCSFTVTVADNQAPVITCPSNIVDVNDSGLCGAVESFNVTATDNCSATVSQLSGGASGSTFGVGTSILSFRATDLAGNTSDCSFSITVTDSQNPTITCPSSVTVGSDAGQCSAVASWTAPVGADNCSGSVTTQTAGLGSGVAFPAGTSTVVTYQVTDLSGNAASCSFTVTVNDTEDPVITCPGNITVGNDFGQCSAVVSFPNATVSDNCPGATVALTGGQVSSSQFGVNSSPNTVEFTATDAAGNTDVCTFTVTVNDTQDPTIFCPSNMVVGTDAGLCTAVVNWNEPVGADNCPGQSTVRTVGPAPGVTLAAQSVTTVTYVVTDASSNTATCSFTITVEDDVFPQISCPADQNITFPGCQYTLLDYYGNGSVTASDNCAPLPIVQTPAPGAIITEETTVQISATDPSGNESICAFTISPLDNSTPTFDNCPTVPEQVAVNSSCQLFIPDYSTLAVSDDCNPTFTFSQTPNAGSPVSTTTSVTVTVSDGTNSATCTFNVEPLDATNPTIVCPATQVESVDANCQLTLPDYTTLATAADNCDTSVDVTQSPTGLVSGNTPVTLTATDDAGNTAACTFQVVVDDDTDPTLACPSSVTKQFNANCQYVMENLTGLATSVADNCPGQLTLTQSPAAGTSIGATSSVFVITVTDASGNQGSCSINLEIEDATAPVVVCPTAQTVTVDAGCDISLADYTSLVSATDNCPSLSTVTVTQSPVPGSSFDLNANPTVAVTMTASDGTNSSTCSFNVILEDETAPTLVCPSDITVTGNASCQYVAGNYTSLVSGNAGTLDNCDGSLTFTQSPTQGTTVQGTTTITVTGTDDSGNAGTCTFSLIVEDNSDPSITCPANQTAIANASCQITLSSYTFLATTSDNCDQNVTVTQSPAAGTVSGTNVTVTLTAVDDAGNDATCTFVVEHVDQTAPSITCPSNQTVSADVNCQFALANYTSGFATTSDNCDLSVTVTQSPLSGSTQSGLTQVTLTVADDDGNTSTCTFNVTPVDNSNPTISCPADQVVSSSIVGGNCIFLVPDLTGTATANDNCDVSVSVTQSPAVSTVISATTTVTLTAEDDNGNTSTCSFDLILNDDADPTITCPGNLTVDADANCEYTILDYTALAIASDNCAAEPDVTQGTSPAIGSTIGVNDPTTITLTATDDSSNTASCTFVITAQDITAPVVTCPSSPQVVSSNTNCLVFLSNYTSSASSVDNCDGSGLSISQSPVAGSAIGATTVVTLSSSDAAGNIGQCTFTVELDDSTAPTIVCPSNQTVATDALCGYSLADYTGFGTTSDNCDLTVEVEQSPAIGASVSGVTTVTLTASDDDENSSSCTFDVIGQDQIAPVLTNCPVDATVPVSPTCTYTVGSYSATVSDNCDGSPTVTQAPLAGSLIGGATVVTITATDASGNAGTCSFTLTPQDVTVPTIFDCPNNITQVNDEAVCGAVVTYGTITSIDNCAGVIVPQLTGGLASGAVFPVGTTTVTYLADDGNGNTTTCTFNVTVNDTEDPIIVCPADITVDAAAGTCGADVAYSLPTVTDNCTSPITPTLQVGLASNSNFPVGPTTVTYGAVDAYGNDSSCSFTVTVVDNEAPVITCPNDIVVGNDPGLCEAVVTYSLPTVTDNCTSGIVPTLTLGFASGSSFPFGVTPVRYMAEDAAGNTSICSFSVTVEDTELPVLTCPNDTSIMCDATVAYDAATATDNCSNSVVVTETVTPVFVFGANTVTFEGDDGNGNISTCSFVVTVIDTVAPVIDVCPTDQFESFDASCNLTLPDYTGLASSTDNCDGAPVITQAPTASSVVTGTTTVTITSTDFAGNSTSCTFTVTDNTPPVVVCPSNQTVGSDINCEYELLDYTALSTSSDNCGGVSLTQSPAIGTLVSAQTTVTITAEDDFGNTSSCTLEVILEDNIDPSITCIGNQSAVFDANCMYQLPNYTGQAVVEDNCDFSLDVTQSPTAGSMIGGATSVTLTATDDNGNSNSCSFTVTPVDNIPPTIVCPSTQVAQLDANCEFAMADYTAMGVTADNCATVIGVTQTPAAGTTQALSTVVVLTAQDDNGNSASCAFVVVPEDNIDPVIVCPADQAVDFTVNCDYSLIDFTGLGTPSDNCSSQFLVTQSPAVGTIVTGPASIELTVNDGNGNSGTCTFQVLPEDNLPPTITCAPDQFVVFDENCQFEISDYNGFAVTADNCSNTITISQSPVAGTFISGTSTVTLTATDQDGNSATCDFVIYPDDQSAPTIVCPADQNVSLSASCAYLLLDYTGMATAEDNCSGNVVVTQDVLVGTVITSTATVTLTATDGNGNTESCSFDVIPADNTPPMLSCPGSQLVAFDNGCQFEIPDYKLLISASDNCGFVLIDQSPAEGTIVTAQTTVTMTVEDGNGNSVFCTFDVIPSDDQLPSITCPNDQEVDLDGNCQFTLLDYTALANASDNCTSIISVGQFPPAGVVVVSSTNVELSVQDDSGNEASCMFSITVDDSTVPVASQCPEDQVVVLGSNCQTLLADYRSGIVATDNCDQQLTYGQLPLPGTELVGVGITQVQVGAGDDAGNYAVCDFTVETVDETAPSITCPSAQLLTLTPNCVYVLPNYSTLAAVSDACGPVTVTQSPVAGTEITGQLNTTLIAEDESGNTSTCTFFVNVLEYEVSVTGTDVSCNGGDDGTATVTVTGGTAPYTEDWGGFNPEALAQGFYTVTVTDVNGCSVVGEVTIEDGPSFVLETTPSGNVSICEGSSLSINAGAGFAVYNWSTGATVQSISVTNEGQYWVRVTNSIGCVSNTDTITVSFYDSQIPEVTSVADGLLACSNDTASTYQWYLNGNAITGATDATYCPATSGNYYVVITDSYGCVVTSFINEYTFSEDSPCSVGIEEHDLSIGIQPNPSTGQFIVSFAMERAMEMELMVFDLMGNLLMKPHFIRTLSGIAVIDLSDKAEGVYLLRIGLDNNRRIFQQRLVVVR